jgi:tetratricopeptide (TPR) repeat protein
LRIGVVNAYSHREAARILKISPARLRYWERTDFVRPSVRDGHAGGKTAFGFRDLARLKGVLGLIERGVPLRRIRRSARDARLHLPELRDPLSALRLWDERSNRVVVEHGGALFEPDGQMVLDFRQAAAAAGHVAALPQESLTAHEWFERGCGLDADPATQGEAIEAYRSALEIDPRYADAHCNLGTVYYNQGRRAAALEGFQRALEIDPFHLEANFNAASLLEEQREEDAALRHYRMVLRVDPLYVDAHVNIALLYEKLGLAAKAREHWRRYLQVDPGGAWADVARRHLDA